MKKHTSKEALFERMRHLAEVDKKSVKETKSTNLGSLVDFKKAADGVAYGIIKENHNYYIKKGGLKENPNVSDFAFIGGLSNITNYQYKTLAEADKNRNMLFSTINEAVSLRANKKTIKGRLNENKASVDIEKAEDKLNDLEFATDAAEEVPDMGGEETPDMGGEEVPDMGGEETPDMGGEEVPDMDGEEVPDMGGEETPDMGGEETPDMGDEETPDMGGEETPDMGGEETPDMGGEEVPDTGDEEDEEKSKLQSDVSHIADEIKNTTLDAGTIKWILKRFIQAFLPEKEEELNESVDDSKMGKLDIGDRKEIADMILNVVSPDEVSGLEQNVEDTEARAESGVYEEKCSECGKFTAYAESRGYTKESIMECSIDEMSNLVSGYANAYNEGMNDGGFNEVALFTNEDIMKSLSEEYGHDDYVGQLSEYVNQLSESSEEDRIGKINELTWSGIKGALGHVGGDVKSGIQKGAQAVGGAVQKGADAVGQYAQGVKQSYYAGEKDALIKKLEKVGEELKPLVNDVNAKAQKAGQQPINLQSLLQKMTSQILQNKPIALNVANEGIVDPANIQTQHLTEEDEENQEIPFAQDNETIGVDIPKLNGAPTTGIDVNVDGQNKSVNIKMSESEIKLRKYIRERLEVLSGKKKANLNESKKSEKLKKFDKIIEEQFKLYETVKKKDISKQVVDEGFGWTIREKFEKLDPNNQGEVDKLFKSIFGSYLTGQYKGAFLIGYNNTTPQEIYNIIKQYVDAGEKGAIAVTKDKKLMYVEKSPLIKGGGLSGRGFNAGY